MNYRFAGKRDEKRNSGPVREKESNSILIPGILNEPMNMDAAFPIADDEESNESVSDDGSNCDMEESAFQFHSIDVDDNEEDHDLFGTDWRWDKWEKLGKDEKIIGPEEHDHYNGNHGIKEGIGVC